MLSRWGAEGGQKPHLVPPTWSNRTYFQIVKAKERSEGEGGFGRGRVVLPHGDDLRASEVRLRLLHQEEQKAFAPLFIASASNASLSVKSLKSDNPRNANSIPINQNYSSRENALFSEPQQITEKLLEFTKSNELNSAKIMAFPMSDLS